MGDRGVQEGLEPPQHPGRHEVLVLMEEGLKDHLALPLRAQQAALRHLGAEGDVTGLQAVKAGEVVGRRNVDAAAVVAVHQKGGQLVFRLAQVVATLQLGEN